MSEVPRLLLRASGPEARRRSQIAATLTSLDAGILVAEYNEMMLGAPRRGADGYQYFVPRVGGPPQRNDERRREERLAMALANDRVVIMAGGEAIAVIFYSFPLFSKGGAKGIRGVDLVGYAAATRRFWVIELKISAVQGRGETPLRALYETLVYGAVVESNSEHIGRELEAQGCPVDHPRPGLLVIAPSDYWQRWTPDDRIGDWWNPYRHITESLAQELGTPVETIDLGPIAYRIDPDGRPRMTGELDCQPVAYQP